MDQASRPAIDEGKRRRDQRVIGRSEPDLLGEGKPQHHSRLAVIGQAIAGCAVDQRIKVRQPPQRLARDRDSQAVVRRRKVADRGTRSLQRLPAPQYGIEQLQRRAPRTYAFNAWHRPLRSSS